MLSFVTDNRPHLFAFVQREVTWERGIVFEVGRKQNDFLITKIFDIRYLLCSLVFQFLIDITLYMCISKYRLLKTPRPKSEMIKFA